ncbi:hypothetical protein [Candidatus Thiosymbion oneisti]|uniref:hypothetical protein n=1 Tax=Candidatus Thiosymbion oneisti TaxID=589554 RepID=UPI000B7D8928|nr:hypothetical protein [Candidatus Thiosymbion oneisti]
MTEIGEDVGNQTDPPEDICEKLRKKIDELINRNKRELGGGGTHGLKHRFAEQVNAPLNHGPGTPEWINHEGNIKGDQKALRRALERFRDNHCGPPPNGAGTWARRPVPTREQWLPRPAVDMDAVKVVAGGTVAGGAGYLIYRGIRMLPSLAAPPLWPTIPANLAIP